MLLCMSFQVKLTGDNIRMILDTLVYDGSAEVEVVIGQQSSEEKEEEDNIQRLYRVAKPVLQDTGFSRVPCGICPVSVAKYGHLVFI